jgi:hypothetical protein
LTEPAFIKPPNDKSFPARIDTGSDLPGEYEDDSPVLVAAAVSWEKEFRCFVLDRQPRTVSVYLRGGELQRRYDFQQSEDEVTEVLEFIRLLLRNSNNA